jgi:hypothetical protein
VISDQRQQPCGVADGTEALLRVLEIPISHFSGSLANASLSAKREIEVTARGWGISQDVASDINPKSCILVTSKSCDQPFWYRNRATFRPMTFAFWVIPGEVRRDERISALRLRELRRR